MAKRRKLQVFVSSTYTDLIEERQAAVEAILTASHIPAGMELFAGQNEEQMNIIKRWIDESDIYLLLLGGRYGSIDEESKKSYTHLEYDYAKETGKTIFVVVAHDDYINEKVREKGAQSVMELDHRDAYTQFKKTITGKYVKYWKNSESLQLAIINTLHELERDERLIGWVPGSEVTDSAAIAEEIARLAKENAELRSIINQTPKDNTLYNGLLFEEMYQVLSKESLRISSLKQEYKDCFIEVTSIFNDTDPSVIHVFWVWAEYIKGGDFNSQNDSFLKLVLRVLEEAGLINTVRNDFENSYRLNSVGRDFLLKLKLHRNTTKAKESVTRLKLSDSENAQYNFFYPRKK